MERESWKNFGLAGAAIVALGCGALWVSSMGRTEEATQLVSVPRPVKDPAPSTMINSPKPKPPSATIVEGPKRRPKPTTAPVEYGRKPARPPGDGLAIKKPTRPAA